jgi:gamma-glutamylcyclotransferase (GGCT)/AIG2-like uncharacterized protein YtfP
MRGEPLHPTLARGATFVGDAFVAGRLLNFGRWPGLVAGAGRVRGELYRLDADALLPVLDRTEGVQFVRRRTVVMQSDGRRARAWVYRYAGPHTTAPLIPRGDWRRRHDA